MARFKSGVQVLIDPKDIKVGRNSRWAGLDQEKVEEYALSYEVHGQLQAVQVRNIAGDDVELVLGYHRHAAMILHNERNLGKELKLKCVVTTCNEEEALTRGIIENKCKLSPSPMDDAFNQRRLREDHGWDNKRIAELYQCADSRVSILTKLLSLPKEVQLRVHRFEIGVKAAADLAELAPEDQAEVLAESKEAAKPTNHELPFVEPGDVPAPKPSVNERIAHKSRERKIEKGGSAARTLNEVKKFFESMIEPGDEDPVSDNMKELAKTMLKFFKGQVKDKTFAAKLSSLIKGG